MPLEPNQVIDEKYRVVRLLGEGGMGAVYEGENVRIKRRVAIKTLHSQLSQDGEIVARFEREAQAAGRIGSDHILEVLDLGALPSGERYIVMEFLDGEPLAARLERNGRMAPEQLVPIFLQVLAGLAAAHGAGVIHRDLKPDNIFILRQKAGRADFVKLIDFGISKFLQAEQGSFSMTRTGTMLGTPLYMSPEQANGSAEADARSDLYAVGIILYEALAGASPFASAKSINELLFQIVLSEVPPLTQVIPGFDSGLWAFVAKAIARPREQRFQSAQEMAAALEAWAQGAGVPTGASTGVGNTGNLPALSVRTPSPQSLAEARQGPASFAETAAAGWGHQSSAGVPALARRSPWLIAGGAALVLLAGGGGWLALHRGGDGERANAGGAAAGSSARAKTADDDGRSETRSTRERTPGEVDAGPPAAPSVSATASASAAPTKPSAVASTPLNTSKLPVVNTSKPGVGPAVGTKPSTNKPNPTPGGSSPDFGY
jgi:tRNA A-37 threonylcarbamoyl transferase component Bud32